MKQLLTFCRLGMALAIVSPTLLAQERAGSDPTVFEVTQRFAEWNQANGSNWHTYSDVQTGYVQFLFGGNAEAIFEPTNDKDFFELGRIAVEDTAGMHGIESETLIEDRGLHLPLGIIGSSDKFTVRFAQEVNGTPVLGAAVNTLFTPDGRLLSVQTTAMPGIAGMSTDAAVGATQATRQALGVFEAQTGLVGNVVNGPNKVIGQLDGDKSREAMLVWQIDVEWHAQDAIPEGYSYWIDARHGGVVYSETTIHNFDVGGTLSTMATPGIHPDQANNPPVSFPMSAARVVGSGGAGTVYTDANGNFNFPGVSGPINITVQYYGDWVNVDNDVGSDYQLATSVNGTGNAVMMNPSPSALITSQSSTFQIVSAERDWVRAVNPSDGTGDFRALANVNLNSTCNAYFNGTSVNMYQAGGGCNATSYSTVVSHEMGHWYNVLYGTGNGSDGMGEGNADAFSLLMYNTPNLGMDFQGQGSGPLRNGNNMLQFCGDSNPGCHGGAVHTEGQVWMGACWKIYQHLETAFGSSQADMITDALFLGWMNSYNQTQIKSVIETQWLTLDDDNGNINDGTPHYNELDDGFKQQGWPGFDLPLIDIQSVTELPDQDSEIGPYVVDVTVVSLIGQTITGVDLLYNVNGGAFSTVAMSSTGGNNWSGGIPGQISPVVVRYYVEATDSLGNTDTAPEGPGSQQATYKFVIGTEVTLYIEDFESGEGGWTHASFGDTSNNQDDWQFGTPGGESGDPSSAASGSNCWGNDLAIGNFNGAYQDDVHNYLRSPNLDCSNAVGIILRYNRWLNVEEGTFDQARIKINGTQVWTNPLSGHTTDSGWVSHEIDISAVADNNPSVQIEFSLQTDGGLTFGGWTLDDVELLYLEPVSGSCTDPVNYCNSLPNSVGPGASIGFTGSASLTANNLTLTGLGLPPNVPGIFFYADTQTAVFFGEGLLCVTDNIQRLNVLTTDVLGTVTQALDLNSPPFDAGIGQAISGATKNFQFWHRDVLGGPNGFNTTDGLSVTFCD